MESKAVKTAASIIVILITVLMLILLAVTTIVSGQPDNARPVLNQQQEKEPYLLRTYNGHIAVFFDGDDVTPRVETSIETNALRSVDRVKLENGIQASNYDEVLKLLEDFGS